MESASRERVRTAPRSWPEFWLAYDAGEWEPETKSILARFLGPGSLFVDVGAWIGPVTLWAVELGARVVALEPDEAARVQLIENVTGLPVEVRPQALAATDGEGFLSNPWELGDSRSRLSASGVPVETISPETLLDGIEPDLVKVDIEGGEIEVLPILAPLCRRRLIPLFVSWHEDWWQEGPSHATRRDWFAGCACEGEWGAFGSLLAIP